MAQDEVFAGPMGESVPTSISSFAHRRGRADSTASFTYYQEEEDEPLPPSEDDSAILDDDESEVHFQEDQSADLEAGELSTMRRTSSRYSRSSVHDRLLRRDSARTDGSVLGRGQRTSQKIYIVTEDLTIVVAGFQTSTIGFALYVTLCVLTLGLVYLLLRWLPRWQVKIIGSQCPLRDCTWVVIENQWGEFMVQDIESKEYGRPLSTIFNVSEKRFILSYDEDDDPILDHLRVLDYRYMRFCFHPLKDRFMLSNSWKDPGWTDVKSIRAGIDGDEKENRELVFGKNLIDIKQKTIPQLLVDEVRNPRLSIDLAHKCRHSIPFTFSKWLVSFYGPWTNTTIMLVVSFLFLLSVSRLLSSILDRLVVLSPLNLLRSSMYVDHEKVARNIKIRMRRSCFAKFLL